MGRCLTLRRRMLCAMCLAASVVPASAQTRVSEDVALSPSVVAFAASIGLGIDHNEATFVPDMIRLAYAQPDAKRGSALLESLRGKRPAQPPTAGAPVVPVPLTFDVWSRVVFQHTIAPGDLIPTILADRRAAFLCHGLAGLDDETLTYFMGHPPLVAALYDHGAAAFGAFAGRLRIRGNRVLVPGGEPAVALWQSAVGESVQAADRFVRALFTENEGRLAYLYDTIASLDAPHAAFVLGAWVQDPAVRLEGFRLLVSASIHGYHEWRIDDRPFARPASDFTIAMTRLRVEPSGAPAAPADRTFWNAVFESNDLQAPVDRNKAERGLIDAAYLAEATSVSDMYARVDRIDQLSLGQRVFAKAPADAARDLIQVLRAMPHQRMLMFALERMGITRPAVYLAASRQAHTVTVGDSNRAFWLLAQLQGALAVVARLRQAGTIDEPTAERLVISVCAVPIVDDRYEGRIAQWIDRELLPQLPAGPTVEMRLLAGLSGRTDDPRDPQLVWEGQRYRLDFASAEARRLRLVRERQRGQSIDVALALARLARRSPEPSTSGPGPQPSGRSNQATASSLKALAENFPIRSVRNDIDTRPPGVSVPSLPRERIDRALDDLNKVDESRDPARVARVAASLVDTADVVLSEALLSIVYALDLGDPDGAALLASNVALRHDFGFGLAVGEVRARRPWDVPRQDFLPGVPWHVTGSLLGLDIALAPMSLRHVDIDRFADAPHLSSVEREAFAVGTALMDAGQLRDADREAIVAAIARGRRRVEALTAPGEDATAVGETVALDGWRGRALDWTLRHRPATAPSLFSLAELLTLGGGAPDSNLDAWGPSAFLFTGCACTKMTTPGAWRLFAGRSQLAFLSFVVPDLNLRVAAVLSELRLPSALERPVLAAAMQDFIDDVAPADGNDWLALAQSAQTLTRQRIEDYVAMAAAIDGPLVPVDDGAPAASLP